MGAFQTPTEYDGEFYTHTDGTLKPKKGFVCDGGWCATRIKLDIAFPQKVGTDIEHAATRCPVLRQAMLLPGGSCEETSTCIAPNTDQLCTLHSQCTGWYAPGTSSTCPNCYAMSGTDVSYAGTEQEYRMQKGTSAAHACRLQVLPREIKRFSGTNGTEIPVADV
eukprot:3189239-Rhodomonas_salina.6